MQAVHVTGPGTTAMVEVDEPTVGPHDILVKVRACGICGSDAMYTTYGGVPPRQGATPLGHEPAGEVAEVGAQVTGVEVGDHVVLNPMACSDGIIGSGGAQGGFSPLLAIYGAVAGTHFRVIPDHIPFEVAALNEPMAVARHAVNRSGAGTGTTAVVFGAGPIGLGALLSLKATGAARVVVVDLVATRLEKALAVGADAVVNSAEEDVQARLTEILGEAPQAVGQRGAKVDADVYIDAAGAAPVVQSVLAMAKRGACLTIPAVHKKPVEIDLGAILTSEISIVMSMGYPTEIFEVTDDIIGAWEKYQLIISDRFDAADVLDALELAATPGAADKVMVTFD